MRVTVETDNKTAHDLYPGPLDCFNALKGIPVPVLGFMTFSETGIIGRLDADKDGIKSGPAHQIQKIRIIGQIYRCLGKEDTSLFIFSPINQGRQQL